MFNKLYENIKKFISENYLFIIGIGIGLFISLYELPYYISAPGGVIDVSSKIEIEGANEVKGGFNMAYVTEYKSTIPMLIIAKLKKDWDIEKQSDVLASNETDEDDYIRNHLMLEEANQNAVIYAYKKAGKEVVINNTDIYSIFIYEEAKTDLKVGDKIKEVNGIKINNKNQLLEIVRSFNVGDILKIKVINNDKEYIRTAEIIEVDGVKLIGIMLSVINDYTVSPDIKINFSKSESGPSGGLLMSLSIYNYLIEEDITKGQRIAGTGTIDENGNVGSIGGVEYKIKGAVRDNIEHFLIPSGENYEEAIKVKNENNYDINIYPVSTFNDALEVLSDLK